MALAHFQRTFTDAAGNIKPGLAVTVRRESDNGLAALFADAGSVTAKSNPFNTDANGYGSFYVVDGRYRIQATDIDWRDTDIFISPTFYAQLAGGPLANFTAMPQVGGDPIVESGSNSDGEWTRWSDGKQTCESPQTAMSFSAVFDINFSWDYPAAFISTPTVVPILVYTAYYFRYRTTASTLQYVRSISTTGATIGLASDSAWSTADAAGDPMQGLASGRWK